MSVCFKASHFRSTPATSVSHDYSARQMDRPPRHGRPPVVSVSRRGFYLPVLPPPRPPSSRPPLVRRRIAYAISATVRRSAKRSDENDNPSSACSSNLGCCCCYAITDAADAEIQRQTACNDVCRHE